MTGFSIRRVTAADAEALVRMANDFDAEDMGAETLRPFTVANVTRDMIGPDATLTTNVAVAGDRLAGFTNHLPAYRFESAEPAIWLESLYVVPEFRRAGVARALMAAVAADAVARDAAAVYWGVRMVNDGGKGFYRAIGAESEKAEILALYRPAMAALTA
jgi:GNAT superfamily N-acetyltransferase